MPGTRWKCWRCRRAISQARPTRFPARRMRCCNCASSSAPGSIRPSMPCESICMTNGFPMVEVSGAQSFAASRTDFDSPWVNWTAELIRQTTGKAPAILPNFGGSLPNDVFSEGLGLPTIWVPHSYPGCSQHAPNEHILLPVTEEALDHHGGLVLGSRRERKASLSTKPLHPAPPSRASCAATAAAARPAAPRRRPGISPRSAASRRS